MWRSQAGAAKVAANVQDEDDDWETDPDFVVRKSLHR